MLYQTGVEYVVKGYADVIRSMNGYVTALGSMKTITANRLTAMAMQTAALTLMSRNLQKITVDMGKTQRAAYELEKATMEAFGAMGGASGPLDKMSDKLHGLVANFTTIRGGMNALGSSLMANAGGPGMGGPMTQKQAAFADFIAGLGRGAANVTQTLTKVGMALGVVNAAAGIVVTGFGMVGSVFTSVGNTVSGVVGSILRVVGTLAGGVKDAFTGIISIVGRAISPIIEFGKRVAEIAIGVSIAGILRAMTDDFRDLSAEVLNAISAFQRLNIQFQTLATRDAMQTYGLSATTAMKQASGAAQTLLDWVRKLAVTTPFTAESLASVTALANAYGLPINAAKRLVVATGDFTAAMGLTEDHLYRIIYNFGQMAEQGKVTGREFRDLAISFVPVYDILGEMGKEIGKTKEEMISMAMNGELAAQGFLEKFVQIAERDFPNAMKKMSQTWEGVKNNIHDFIQVYIGMDMLGPTFNKITKSLASALDTLLNSSSFKFFTKTMGDVLSFMFDDITRKIGEFWSAVVRLANAYGIVQPSLDDFVRSILTIEQVFSQLIGKITSYINDLTTATNGKMQNWAQQMFGWGRNLIMQFARGMGNAARFIVDVISQIANLIATWFQPHSPPKIAELIDRWGAETATLWVRGWLKGDFSLFNDIADLVEQYLRAVPEGVIPDGGLIPLILGSRQTLTDAVKSIRQTGEVTTQVVQSVISSAGYISKEFDQYIRALVNVEKETYNVQRAEERQNLVQELTVENLRNAGTVVSKLTGQLKGMASQYVISMTGYDRVTNQIAESENSLAKVTEYYSDILEDLNYQLRNLTDTYDENLRLNEIQKALTSGLLTGEERMRLETEKQSILLKQQIRQTEHQRDVETDRIEDNIAALKYEKQQWQDGMDNKKNNIDDMMKLEMEAAKARQAIAQEQLDSARALIEYQIKQNELINEYLDALKKASGSGDTPIIGGGFDLGLGDEGSPKAKGKFNQFAGIPALFEDASKAATKFLDDVAKAMGQVDFKTMTKNIGDMVDKFTAWKTEMQPVFDAFKAVLGDRIKNIASNLERISNVLFKNKGGASNAILDFLMKVTLFPITTLDAILTDVRILVETFDNGKKWVSGFMEELDKLTKAEWLPEHIKKDIEKIEEFGKKFEWLGGIFGLVGLFVYATIQGIVGFFQWMSDVLVGNSIIPDMWQAIYDETVGKLTEILDWIGDWVADMWQKFVDWKDSVINSVQNAYDLLKMKFIGIKKTLTELWTDVVTNAKTKWEEFVKSIKDKAVEIGNAVSEDITAGIANFKTKIIDPLAKGFADVLKNAKDLVTWIGRLGEAVAKFDLKALTDLLHHSPPPLALGMAETRYQMQLLESQVNSLSRTVGRVSLGSLSMPASISNVRNTEVTVNANYQRVQSPVGVKYDVMAALGASR